MKRQILVFLIIFLFQLQSVLAIIGIDICSCDENKCTATEDVKYLRIIAYDIDNDELLQKVLFLKKTELKNQEMHKIQGDYGFVLLNFGGDVEVRSQFNPTDCLLRTVGKITASAAAERKGIDRHISSSLPYIPSVGLVYSQQCFNLNARNCKTILELADKDSKRGNHVGPTFILKTLSRKAKGDIGEAMDELMMLSYGPKPLAIKYKEQEKDSNSDSDDESDSDDGSGGKIKRHGIDGAYEFLDSGIKKYIITEVKAYDLNSQKKKGGQKRKGAGSWTTPKTLMSRIFKYDQAKDKLDKAVQKEPLSKKNAEAILAASHTRGRVYKLAHLINLQGRGRVYVEEFYQNAANSTPMHSTVPSFSGLTPKSPLTARKKAIQAYFESSPQEVQAVLTSLSENDLADILHNMRLDDDGDIIPTTTLFKKKVTGKKGKKGEHISSDEEDPFSHEEDTEEENTPRKKKYAKIGKPINSSRQPDFDIDDDAPIPNASMIKQRTKPRQISSDDDIEVSDEESRLGEKERYRLEQKKKKPATIKSAATSSVTTVTSAGKKGAVEIQRKLTKKKKVARKIGERSTGSSDDE